MYTTVPKNYYVPLPAPQQPPASNDQMSVEDNDDNSDGESSNANVTGM